MSKMWEVTVEDIQEILEAHGCEESAEKVFNNFTENLRVEKAVCWYSDYNQKISAAKDEIEDILIGKGIIEKPKLFFAP